MRCCRKAANKLSRGPLDWLVAKSFVLLRAGHSIAQLEHAWFGGERSSSVAREVDDRSRQNFLLIFYAPRDWRERRMHKMAMSEATSLEGSFSAELRDAMGEDVPEWPRVS